MIFFARVRFYHISNRRGLDIWTILTADCLYLEAILNKNN